MDRWLGGYYSSGPALIPRWMKQSLYPPKAHLYHSITKTILLPLMWSWKQIVVFSFRGIREFLKGNDLELNIKE